MATPRVLGFTKGEVASILHAELAIIVLVALPIGLVIGLGMSWTMAAAFSSDLSRVPFVIRPDVHATASLLVWAAAALSALAVRHRINPLDIIEVLETPE